MSFLSSSSNRPAHRWAIPLFAFTVMVAGVSFGCTDCVHTDYGYTPLGRVEVITQAPLDAATATYRYHCWASATGPRVGFWVVKPVWRVPGTMLTLDDVTIRQLRLTTDGSSEVYRTCEADACPVASIGDVGMNCIGGICEPYALDFEIQVLDPSAIPVGGVASEFVMTVDFFDKVANGSGDTRQPPPADADVSDITTDIGCALVLP